MEIAESKKFAKFVSDNKDTVYSTLSRWVKLLPEADMEDIYHKSAMVLYEKIDNKILTTMEVKSQLNGIEMITQLPVLSEGADASLLKYFVEICKRQILKFVGKKKNIHKSKDALEKEGIRSMAEATGMSEADVTEMLAGYTGFMKSDYSIKEIELDGCISDGQWKEILEMCEETDNSRYQRILSLALDSLAQRCRKLLRSYYAQKTSWADIASLLGINGGANSAKVAASRCRKTLFQKCHVIEREYHER